MDCKLSHEWGRIGSDRIIREHSISPARNFPYVINTSLLRISFVFTINWIDVLGNYSAARQPLARIEIHSHHPPIAVRMPKIPNKCSAVVLFSCVVPMLLGVKCEVFANLRYVFQFVVYIANSAGINRAMPHSDSNSNKQHSCVNDSHALCFTGATRLGSHTTFIRPWMLA